MDPRSTPEEREKYEWIPEITEWRLAKTFGWTYWTIRRTPLEWRHKILLIDTEVSKIETELTNEAIDKAKRGSKGSLPRGENTPPKFDGTERTKEVIGASQEVLPPAAPGWERQAPIPMSQWSPDLFENNEYQQVSSAL